MIIDATNVLVGRLGSFVAKKALLGEKIIIINCEKATVSGGKAAVLAHYKQKMDRGTYKGPFFFRRPEAFVKRTIRGMLPYKKELGRKALQHIMCYKGVPSDIKEQPDNVPLATIDKLPNTKYITVQTICKRLG